MQYCISQLQMQYPGFLSYYCKQSNIWWLDDDSFCLAKHDIYFTCLVFGWLPIRAEPLWVLGSEAVSWAATVSSSLAALWRQVHTLGITHIWRSWQEHPTHSCNELVLERCKHCNKWQWGRVNMIWYLEVLWGSLTKDYNGSIGYYIKVHIYRRVCMIYASVLEFLW